MIYQVKVINLKSHLRRVIKSVTNDWILRDFLKIPKRVIMDKDQNTIEINLNENILIFSSGRPSGEGKSRIRFNVKYKKINGFFWRKILNCVKDELIYEDSETPIRVFITDTGERWEIPCSKYEFSFDKNKLLAIQDIMEQESGQKIDAIK